jgi:ribonuclease P protein component
VTDASFPTVSLKIGRLQKRPDFLACARAPHCARGAVLIQARLRDQGLPPDSAESSLVRVGFTATKRIGGAVQRNRAKRRLREAVRQVLPALASPGYDYVFIARGGVIARPWARLLDDVKSALLRLAADRDRPATEGPSSPQPDRAP